ncbi:MAG: hypothetical protein ACI87E_004110 [Mariniblastus sp.]|jgi:hypothetical protein
MQVKLNWFIVFSVVIFLVVVSIEPTFCQSVAVQVPGGRAGSIETNTAWPSNTMSAEMRRWDAILDMTYPSRFNGKLTGRELVAEMNRLGLPTILSVSAKDDSLDFDDHIELPLPNSSLRTRLFAGLKDVNATIWYAENRIGIISLDDSEESEYFLTATYDVTSLVHGEPYDLIDTITNTVDPDGWVDTGQGLGTIVANQVNGRHLITIGKEYANHRRVQRLLNGINRLSGSYTSSARSGAVAVPGGSNAVVLPSRRVN